MISLRYSLLLLAISSSQLFAKSDTIEYVNQVLEPTGGKIEAPKEWFYKEYHSGPAFRWTISKENPTNDKPYQTGMNIQLFAHIKKKTKRSPKEFVTEFMNSKRKNSQILSSCSEQDQGLFTRVCLETIEGPYRIMYSGFWGSNNLDMAIMTVSGAPVEQWEQNSPIFQRMSSFELIDVSRFLSDSINRSEPPGPKNEKATTALAMKTYYPQGGIKKDTGRVQTENIRLISAEQEFAKNYTPQDLAAIIQAIQKVAIEEFHGVPSEGAIVLQVNLQKEAFPKIDILQQDDINQDALQRIYTRLSRMEIKTKKSDVSFHIEMKICRLANDIPLQGTP